MRSTLVHISCMLDNLFQKVTLTASAVAFSLGAVSGLNSVRWFSAFATLNTVMIMILMVSNRLILRKKC